MADIVQFVHSGDNTRQFDIEVDILEVWHMSENENKNRQAMINWINKIIAEIPEFEGTGYQESATELVFHVPYAFTDYLGVHYDGMAVYIGNFGTAQRIRFIDKAKPYKANNYAKMRKMIEAIPEVIHDVEKMTCLPAGRKR